MRDFDYTTDMPFLERYLPLSLCAYEIIRLRFLKGVPLKNLVSDRCTVNHDYGVSIALVLSGEDKSFLATMDRRGSKMLSDIFHIKERLKGFNPQFNLYN